MSLRKVLSKIKDELSYTKNTIKNILIREGGSKNFLKNTDLFIKENLKKEIELEELVKIKELPEAREMQFPVLIDENFDNYIQKFMHSYREKEHPTININNLLFLTGAEKCGKTWFLRKNLKSFEEEEGKLKNLVIHYDLREYANSNFQTFLWNFERSIIDSLINKNEFELEANKKEIVSQEKLIELLFYRWEKGWIEINLSKSLKRAISETDTPYTYMIDKGSAFQEIMDLIEKYEKKAFKEYNLIESFGRLVELIQENMQISKLEASLLLIYDCLIQREDLRKPENYPNDKPFEKELHRDGIEVMEYLFDVLNYIAGYHDSQNKKVESSDVDQPRELYPHVVLALESVQEFFNMKDSERRAVDYMHKIMLRLYNNVGYRDHFPVIFESNKNYYFDQIIYNELFDHKWIYPTLFFDSQYYLREVENVLDIYLNNFQKEIVMRFIQKSSVYCYKYIIELIKAHGYYEFEKIFKIQTEIGSKEFYKFYHKINKIYVHPMFANHLDEGKIDDVLVDAMRQWHYVFVHNLDPFISIRRKNYDFEFLNTPITRALMDENIIVYHKYHKRLYMQNYIYNYYNHQLLYFLIKQKLKGFRYFYHNLHFRLFKSFRFESDFFTIGKRKSVFRISARPWEWQSSLFVHGYNLKWDVPMELYKGDYRRTYFYENVIPTNRIL